MYIRKFLCVVSQFTTIKQCHIPRRLPWKNKDYINLIIFSLLDNFLIDRWGWFSILLKIDSSWKVSIPGPLFQGTQAQCAKCAMWKIPLIGLVLFQMSKLICPKNIGKIKFLIFGSKGVGFVRLFMKIERQ